MGMMKLMEVTWDELQIGDVFAEDGAIVQSIFPWQDNPCYTASLEVDNDTFDSEVVMSDTHLIVTKDKSVVINGHTVTFANLELTAKSKEKSFKKECNLIAAQDAYELFFNPELGYALIDGINGKLKIEKYANLEPQKCRCIEVDRGYFTINGVELANSARGDHQLDSMKEIVSDLIRSGMSEQWISKNLFISPETIRRYTQLSGMKAAFANTEALEKTAWDPIKDLAFSKREKIDLYTAARKWCKRLRQLQGKSAVFSEATDVFAAAKATGFDEKNPGLMPISVDEDGTVFETGYDEEGEE